jgi:hypothetical protein
MVFTYNTKTTVESIKEWIITQIDDAKYVGENENSDDEEESNSSKVLQFMINTEKYDVADYLISIGISYTDDNILPAKNIDFIKKYLDITDFSWKFAKNPALIKYCEENGMLNTKNIITLIKENFDVELIKKYFTKLSDQEIVCIVNMNMRKIFDKEIGKDTCEDLNLIKYVISCINDNDELRVELSKVLTEKIKLQLISHNYCAVPAYGSYNANLIQKYLRELIPISVKNKLLDPNLQIFGTSDNKYPSTLFTHALGMNFPVELLKLLIDCGSDINFINDHGNNYLFSCKNNLQTKFLLSNGLNPSHTNKLGKTPLFTVCEVSQVKTLVDAGANPNIKSSDGKTAYDIYYSYSKSKYMDQSLYKSISQEILKYMNVNEKLLSPETKLSDLTVEDLLTIIKLKSQQ